MSERKTIIEIEHLNKTFGDVKAVRDLSFRVKEGELFAFLGVNGAGKSTTISIMCGQQSKDSGKVVISGTDLDESVDSIRAYKARRWHARVFGEELPEDEEDYEQK